jgi:hypothetical protein
MASNLEQWSAAMRASFYELLAPGVDGVGRRAESPLESAFFWTLCGWGGASRGTNEPTDLLPGAIESWSPAIQIRVGLPPSSISGLAFPQVEVMSKGGDRYRLDLAIHALNRASGASAAIAVELDGHDFHERTKEQAERDRKRDRDLQALGWRVARFTGSQVNRDPLVAVRELVSFIESTVGGASEAEAG